jgi:hypothetical protein
MDGTAFAEFLKLAALPRLLLQRGHRQKLAAKLARAAFASH